MATYYAIDGIGELDNANPPQPMPGTTVNATLRRIRGTVNLASQAVIATADAVVLARIPADGVFAFGVLTVSATLGAAAVAIGTNPVHAANGQYRAAAAATTVETPALFGITTAMIAAPLTSGALVYLTTSANLPAAGIVDVELFYSSRS